MGGDEERDRIESQRRQKAAREAQFKTGKWLCQTCHYDGVVTARDRDTGAIYSFRCIHCNAAEQIGLTIRYPAWDMKYRMQFEILN